MENMAKYIICMAKNSSNLELLRFYDSYFQRKNRNTQIFHFVNFKALWQKILTFLINFLER